LTQIGTDWDGLGWIGMDWDGLGRIDTDVAKASGPLSRTGLDTRSTWRDKQPQTGRGALVLKIRFIRSIRGSYLSSGLTT
jgi:hypothetical protein